MEDYKVKNISDAEFGRKEISLAETEMPGLMALRDKYVSEKPLTYSESNPDIKIIKLPTKSIKNKQLYFRNLWWGGHNGFF